MRGITSVFVVAVLAFLSFAAAQQQARCPLSNTPNSLPKNNQNCEQYNELSCCSARYSRSGGFTDDGCRRRPDRCDDLRNMIGCGASCKPDFITQYVDQVTTLIICQSYADKLLKACRDITDCPGSDIDCLSDDTKCEKVYPSDTDREILNKLIQSETGFLNDHVIIASNTNCFNAAGVLSPSALVMIVCSVAVALLGFM